MTYGELIEAVVKAHSPDGVYGVWNRSELEVARVILATIRAAGLAIVPREPTQEMVRAGFGRQPYRAVERLRAAIAEGEIKPEAGT